MMTIDDIDDGVDEMESVIDTISQLQEEDSLPKNVRIKLQEIIDVLKAEGEETMNLNKALDMLDEIADDTNMQSHTRTQIMYISSMLESVSTSL